MSVRGMDSVSLTVLLTEGPGWDPRPPGAAGRPLVPQKEQSEHKSPNGTGEPLWAEGKLRQRGASAGRARLGTSRPVARWGVSGRMLGCKAQGAVGKAWLGRAGDEDMGPTPAPQINKGS